MKNHLKWLCFSILLKLTQELDMLHWAFSEILKMNLLKKLIRNHLDQERILQNFQRLLPMILSSREMILGLF